MTVSRGEREMLRSIEAMWEFGTDSEAADVIIFSADRSVDDSRVLVTRISGLDVRSYGLDPRRDLIELSPDGFTWGGDGAGDAQLALAMLAEFTSDDDIARRGHQHLAARLITKLDRDWWEVTGEELQEHLPTQLNLLIARRWTERVRENLERSR